MSDAPDIETEPGGPVGDVPAVSPDQPDGPGRVGGSRGRGLPFSLAGSILFHVAIAALFLLSPTGQSIATKLAGLKADGPSSYGSSNEESPTGSIGGWSRNAISVTLTSPPSRREPKAEPAKPDREASEPPVRAVDGPQKAPPKPMRPETILAAKTSGQDAAAPQAEKPPVRQKPARNPTQAATRPPPPAAVPVPVPRPPRLAMAKPQTANDAPAGALYGTLGGRQTAPAKGAKHGGKKHGAGDDAVSNYPGTVADRLNASLRYPVEARNRGLSGKTRVQFVVEATGKVSKVVVLSSSGSALLDNAATETVRRAAPFAPIPAEAKRKEWSFSVWLAFEK